MSIEIRELRGLPEFERAEQLQYDVWGADEKADPSDLMFVVQNEGGFVAGAFEGSRLLAYGFGLPTANPVVQHSHRLAVLEEARGRGLGAKIKWYQYDWCAARGIEHIRWTYDPLRLPNAHLNIVALGATVSTYLPDYYGELAGLNAGTESDRLMADWYVGSANARAAREGAPLIGPAHPDIVQRVAIPRDFAGLLASDRAAATDARLAGRQALTAAFASGLIIAGFDRARAEYLLVQS